MPEDATGRYTTNAGEYQGIEAKIPGLSIPFSGYLSGVHGPRVGRLYT